MRQNLRFGCFPGNEFPGKVFRPLGLVVILGLSAGRVGLAAPPEGDLWVVDREGNRPQTRVAVTNVTAWPNLTRLPDGDIVALIYNQPSHGRLPGDVDCWASTDQGESWTLRSVAAPRGTPEQNRMNVAAGLNAEGHLILATSGWSAPGNPDAWSRIGEVLPTWVCRSTDGGRTWEIETESFPNGPDGRPIIPYGDIMPGADGKLRVAAYRGALRDDEPRPQTDDPLARRAADGQNWVVRGDGRNWDAPVPIGPPRAANLTRPFNETALLHLGEGRWVAAARYGSGALFMLYSEDDANTWTWGRRVTRSGFPGHLMQLEDGTILLTYGQRGRHNRGVEVIFSEDEGRTWSEVHRVLDTRPESTDIGYPSNVMRDDGQILTAYYEGGAGVDYFMGVVVWCPVRTREAF